MKKYQIKNTIGSGNFSTVYCAEDLQNHQIYAVKIMKSHPKIASRQAHFLNKMKHPNIIQLIHFQQNKEQSKLFLQHVGINTLQLYQSHSYGLRQQQVKCILFQTALGLSYIHSFGIIHRDIKPENLLIDKKNALVKIIDFGLANAQKKISTDYIATRWYRSPQNLLGTKQYTTAIDVFSLGCVIVQLYLGSPLFPGTNNMDQLYKIFNILGEPTPSNWSVGYRKMNQLGIKASSKSDVDIDLKSILNPCNPKLIDLIHKMLILNPRQRITCDNIVRHEYFKDIKNIIPPSVYKKFQSDFQKNNDPLSFRGFHQVKSAKTSIKQTVRSKLKHNSHHFCSQQSRKQKSSSIDSVHIHHRLIHPSIIKSTGTPAYQNNIIGLPRPRFNTVQQKNQEHALGNKDKLNVVSKPKLIKNNSQLSNMSNYNKEYSRLINQDGIKNSKNSTQQSTYKKTQPNYRKLDKSQQFTQTRKKKSIDMKNKIPQVQKNQGFQKYNYNLRGDRSPTYLQQIKNLQAPKIIKVQQTKNVPSRINSISPSNYVNRIQQQKRKNLQDRNNRYSQIYNSQNNQPIKALKRFSPVMRNGDQRQRVGFSPNNYQRQKQKLVNCGLTAQRCSVLNHYKSFDNLHKVSNYQSHLRKSPQITSRNYSNKFNFNNQQRN